LGYAYERGGKGRGNNAVFVYKPFVD
jgi:hypothetical protein